MLNPAITIAVRKLLKEKLYVSICIGSLAIGIACSLVIALYLYSELTYDQSHENHEQIYRLSTNVYSITMNGAGFETGPVLTRENPEILDYVRFREAPEKLFTAGSNSRVWEEIYLADPSVFNIFTLNVVYGDRETAFTDPYSIAISESFAQYYFGDKNPVGEIVNTERFDFRVSLVYADLPENVQFRYDAILPLDLIQVYSPGFPDSHSPRYLVSVTTYLQVSDAFSTEIFESIHQRYFEAYVKADLPFTAGGYTLRAQALTDNYYSEPILDGGRNGSLVTVYTLAALAVFLLLMACINYINLTTARASKRLREIGMRKVLGASRSQLIFQLLSESFVYCTVSLVAGILLAVCVLELSVLNDLIGKSELLVMLSRPLVIVLIFVLWATVSLVAGLYPAMHLARARVMLSMKSSAGIKQRPGIRDVLVVFQLVISCSIIICVLIMQNQVRFVLDAPLGFETKDKLTVRLRGADMVEQVDIIKQELLQSGTVRAVATASFAPGQGLAMSITEVEQNDGEFTTNMTHPLNVGPDFLSVMEIDLIAGRAFPAQPAGNGSAFVMVSEALVRQMAWDQPLGKNIGSGGEVIGVFRDFHYQSLHEPIGPLVLWPLNNATTAFSNLSEAARAQVTRDLIIAVTGDMSTARGDILDVLSRFTTGSNLELRSLEESWLNFYQDDIRAARLVSIFAGISVFISLLGLIGLTSYAAEQRSKELAIRKALGASIGQTLLLLSRHALLALAVAILPASLLSFYLVQIWLSRFTYTADVTAMPFVWAFLLIAAISITTVILQSWRTATGNPVDKLRYE